MFGSHENQRKLEIPNFVFYREIKIKVIFISIKIGKMPTLNFKIFIKHYFY